MDVAVADADSEKASGAIFAVQSVQRKRLVVTCYAKLPPFRFHHTEKAAFFQRRQHVISAKVLIRNIKR